MDNSIKIRTEPVEPSYSGLEKVAKDLNMPLSPEEEFDLAYATFTINYQEFNAEEMPDEAYEEYRDLEDVYTRNNNPSRLHSIQIGALRDIMQRYAESQRDH